MSEGISQVLRAPDVTEQPVARFSTLMGEDLQQPSNALLPHPRGRYRRRRGVAWRKGITVGARPNSRPQSERQKRGRRRKLLRRK